MDSPVLLLKTPKRSIPVNFHGKKGRSGRGTWDKEVNAKKLWDLAVPVLVYALGPHAKITEDKKVEIALALVSKMLPSEIRGEGISNPVIIVERFLREKINDPGNLRPEIAIQPV